MARSTFTAAVAFADRPDIRWDYGTTRAEPAFVVRASRGGAIQAVDPDGLVEWAQAHHAELVLPRRVGDFVQTGGELVRAYGGAIGGRAATELEGMIALGDERTFDQDPAFALRMMVDIANRALSPAVNDPTTAVQVLEHIGDVLALIGRTDLEKRTRPESAETPAAVVMLTPRWEDFVALGLTEIREYGATSVQVTRRLRALLVDLLEVVRPEHRAALEEELRRLDATVAGAGATRSTSIAHPLPTARGSVTPRPARRTFLAAELQHHGSADTSRFPESDERLPGSMIRTSLVGWPCKCADGAEPRPASPSNSHWADIGFRPAVRD